MQAPLAFRELRGEQTEIRKNTKWQLKERRDGKPSLTMVRE